jgi:hypothetical protein
MRDHEDPPTTEELREKLRGSQLQVDHFCPRCNCNLHGQPVFPHEKFGFTVCACPGCGRLNPAALGFTQTWPAINRFSRVFFGIWGWVWVMAAIFLVGWTIGLQYSFLQDFTDSVYQTRDGRPVVEDYNGMSINVTWHLEDGPLTKITDVIARKVILTPQQYLNRQPPAAMPRYFWQANIPWLEYSAVVCSLSGLFIAVACCHLRNKVLRLIPLPFIVALFTYVLWINLEIGGGTNKLWVIEHLFAMAAFQTMILGLTLNFGRPLARLVVKLILPPVPRQRLAFLWFCDRMPAPSVRAT